MKIRIQIILLCFSSAATLFLLFVIGAGAVSDFYYQLKVKNLAYEAAAQIERGNTNVVRQVLVTVSGDASAKSLLQAIEKLGAYSSPATTNN